MHVLVTGSAGFIGFHLARRLIADGHAVTGVDGMTAYYDVALKRARVAALGVSNLFQATRRCWRMRRRSTASPKPRGPT